MTILEVYMGMKENLEQLGPRIALLNQEIAGLEKQLTEKKEELAQLKDIVEPLQLSKEMLEAAGISEVASKKDIPEEKGGDTDKVKPIKQVKFTTKDPRLVRLDRYDKVLGTYVTQKAAARELGWDQSSLSRFLKLDRSQQISRKNFYFRWEH